MKVMLSLLVVKYSTHASYAMTRSISTKKDVKFREWNSKRSVE